MQRSFHSETVHRHDATDRNAAPGEAEEESEQFAVLFFTVAGQNYAVAVDEAVEVMSQPATTPLPGTPAELLGICFRRGRVLPLVDLAIKLGLPPQSHALGELARGSIPRPPVLVIRMPYGEIGLVVERIVRVVKVPEEAIQSPQRQPGAVASIAMPNLMAHLLDLRVLEPYDPAEASSSGGSGGPSEQLSRDASGRE